MIGALDADVVALQEVAVFNADGDLADQPAELAQMTGMHVRYGAVHAYPLIEPADGRAIGTATWGNALLTRRPIHDGFTIGLPTGADGELVEAADSGLPLAGVRYAKADAGAREPRCAIGGHLPGPGHGLSIVNAHLTYAGRSQRRTQAEELVRIAINLEAPTIVAGDFNAPIEAAELGPMRDSFEDAFSAVGIEPGDERRASCGRNRIDHLLFRGLGVLDCRVGREAGDLSDHLPVVATFEL
jgi:endonuclease/exonuclease/phosphatase family metal-dependent hydrolase